MKPVRYNISRKMILRMLVTTARTVHQTGRMPSTEMLDGCIDFAQANAEKVGEVMTTITDKEELQ